MSDKEFSNPAVLTYPISTVATSGGRRAHLCCGCCCDTRRATIIVNVVNICLVILQLIGFSAVMQNTDDLDDDSLVAALDSFPQWVVYVGGIAAFIFSGLGIFGGMYFHRCSVLAAGIWYVGMATASLFHLGIGNALYCGLFSYPHFVFYNEMRSGIMTEENYPNEVHSCCCV